jgi:hypothetical protein
MEQGSGNDARLVGSVAIAESLDARARSDSKVTGDCAAELQRNAIAAIVNVSRHRHRARSYHFVIAVRRATEAESAA